MNIHFIENETYQQFYKELSKAMRCNEDTMKYFQASLLAYVSSLQPDMLKVFLSNLPDFIQYIEDNQNSLSVNVTEINSFQDLSEIALSRVQRDYLPNEKYNFEKFKIKTIILFNVLQKYMPGHKFLEKLDSERAKVKC